MTARANWRDHAACRDADPELFFPIGTAGPTLRQIGEAKRICRACPAHTQCLAWALDNRVTDGVWGGTTEDERRAIRSLRRRMSTNQQDADGESYQPAEHAEQGHAHRPLNQRRPALSAALKLAINVARREPRPTETQRDVSASEVS
jgi:WhiB family redox-sensing transcriptional regulator